VYNTVAFCPSCYGVFRSRAFPSGPNVTVSNSSEPCIFCGRMTVTESNLKILKDLIINVLKSDQLILDNVKKIEEVEKVLRRLAARKISIDEAEVEIDEISPGLGKRVTDVIRNRGGIAITIMLTAFGLYLAYQANTISQEANDIARETLEFQIEQAAEQAVSQEHIPNLDKKTKSAMSKASPHSTMHKNRKLRRAEEAKKRQAK
jgi:hypothetical protein